MGTRREAPSPAVTRVSAAPAGVVLIRNRQKPPRSGYRQTPFNPLPEPGCGDSVGVPLSSLCDENALGLRKTPIPVPTQRDFERGASQSNLARSGGLLARGQAGSHPHHRALGRPPPGYPGPHGVAATFSPQTPGWLGWCHPLTRSLVPIDFPSCDPGSREGDRRPLDLISCLVAL